MEEKKKNNTALTIIIIIAAVLIIGLVGYFIYNQTRNNDVKEPTTTENGTNDINNNETKSVAGAYSGQYNKNSNVVEDAADAVTNNTSDRVVVELVLGEDNKATFIKVSDTEKTIKGTYTSADNKVVLTATSDKTTDENKTYEFTINADGTLSYKDAETSTDTVTLTKTDKSSLKYYK